MIHHAPETNLTVPHWSGEVNGHLKTISDSARKLSRERILHAIKHCGIDSRVVYENFLTDASKEKASIKFDKPSQEGHEKVLETINRFASELSAGKLPKMFPDNS